ncbi:MAG: hypothetical protein IJR39_08595, partial [Treponema sp.]|nr:hypothetical protein [Treponema sp.]
MTKDDKIKVYNLLKTASDNLCGYASPDFAGEMPEFADDIETSAVLRASGSDGEVSQATQVSSDSTLANINKKISECKRCALCANRH